MFAEKSPEGTMAESPRKGLEGGFRHASPSTARAGETAVEATDMFRCAADGVVVDPDRRDQRSEAVFCVTALRRRARRAR